MSITTREQLEEAGRAARFPAGQSADPTSNMSPEAKAKWDAMNDEHGGKFKTALNGDAAAALAEKARADKKGNGDMLQYFADNPDKLQEKQMRDKAKGKKAFQELDSKFFRMTQRPAGNGWYNAHGSGMDLYFNLDDLREAAQKSLPVQLWSDTRKTKMLGVLSEGATKRMAQSHRLASDRAAFAELAALDMDLTMGSLPIIAIDRDLAALEQAARLAAIDRDAAGQVGALIEEQLGGWNRLRAMLGAYYRQYLNDGYEFGFPNKTRTKGNHVKITLTPEDTYNMEFFNTMFAKAGRMRIPGKSKLVKKLNGVYVGEMARIFTQQTGWALRMAADQVEVLAGIDADSGLLSRFEEGEDADPTEGMSEEDAQKWRLNTLKHKDQFKKDKKAGGDELEAKFEEGVSADPTKDMSPEDAKKWKAENDRNKDKFKQAGAFEEGARIPDGWDSGHIDGEEEEAKQDDGSDVPDGDGNKIRRSAGTINVGPVGKYRNRWPMVYLHGLAEKALGYDVVTFDKPPAQGTMQATLHDNDGKTHEAMIYSWKSSGMPAGLVVLKNDRKGMGEAQDEMRQGKMAREARSGLYGHTKRVQADCESCIKKVQKSAQKIAKHAYGKHEKVAEFLARHAGRSDSLPAHILVAALGEIGPKIAASTMPDEGEQKRATRLAELRALRGSGDTSEMLKKEHDKKAQLAPRGKAQVAIAKYLSSADAGFNTKLTDIARIPALRGVHFAQIMSAVEQLKKKGYVEYDGVQVTKLAKVSDSDSQGEGIKQTNDKTAAGSLADVFSKFPAKFRRKTKGGKHEVHWMTGTWAVLEDLSVADLKKMWTALSWTPGKAAAIEEKTARKYGLYGFSDKVASLGLQACSDVRAETGRIASDLHRRRGAKHANITAFLDTHCKTAECRYSKLLAASYPDATSKFAAIETPRTVAAWLAFDDDIDPPRMAMDHATEEARKKHLKEHPKADDKNHQVVDSGSGGGSGGVKALSSDRALDLKDALKGKYDGGYNEFKDMVLSAPSSAEALAGLAKWERWMDDNIVPMGVEESEAMTAERAVSVIKDILKKSEA
jgi:hypothetical protein